MLAPILEKIVSFVATIVGYIDSFAKRLGFAGVQFKSINKSAKKTLQLISGFDELNTLSSQSSGSSGSEMINPLEDFKPIDLSGVEEKFREFGEKVKQILDEIFNTIGNIDWFDLGQKVWDWIAAVDWGGIMASLSQLLGGIFGAMGSLLAGFFKDGWDKVVQWWYSNAIQDGKFTMEGFLLGIWEVFKNIGKWINEHIFQPFINGFKKLFKIGSPSKVMQDLGTDIVNGLFLGLSTLWKTVKQIFVEMKDNIKLLVSQTIANLKDFYNQFLETLKNLFTKISNYIKDTSAAFVEKVRDLFTKIGEFLSNTMSNFIESIKNVLESVKSAIENWKNTFTNGISTMFETCKNTAKGFWNNLMDGARTAWDSIKNVFSSVTDWFRNTFSRAWEAVKAVFSSGSEVFSGIKEGIDETFKKVVNSLITGINSVISWPFNKINKMLNWIKEIEILGFYPFWDLWGYNPVWVPSIPYLAKGGVINSPTMAMMGEYPGAGNNPEIVTPQNLLKEIISAGNTELANVYIQVGRQIISAIEGVDLEVNIGDDTIAKSAARGNKAYYLRTGQQLI